MKNMGLIAAVCISFFLVSTGRVAYADNTNGIPSPYCASFEPAASTLHVPCLNLGGAQYWFDSVYCSLPIEDASIVTVDGLDMANTLMASDIPDTDSYVYQAVDSFTICPNARSFPFSWNRNAGDTARAVQQLRQWLQSKYADAKAKGEKLIVVSHSWGTFLTYAALYDEPEITVDLYITLASPLGTRLHPRGADTMEGNLITGYVQYWLFRLGLPSENHHLSNVKTAVNYWAYGDLISGPLSLASASSNIMVDSGEENNYTPDLQSTEKWHKYDSLQPGSVPDNQPLRDMVAGNIFALLGGPAVGFTLGNAGIPVDLTLPDTFRECSEYSAVENKIHVPCLSLGSSTFWIDLLPHTTATPLLLEVGGFGENVPSAPQK